LRQDTKVGIVSVPANGEASPPLDLLSAACKMPGVGRIGPDQFASVRRGAPAAFVCGSLNAVIAVAALWGAVSSYILIGWLVAGVGFAAWLMRRRMRTGTPEPRQVSRRSIKRAVLRAMGSAAPWTVLPPMFLGSVSHQGELILIALCAGMAAGGAVLLAPIYPAALAYLGLVIAGFALKCGYLALEGQGYGLLCILTLSYGVFLVAVVATTSRSSIERTDALRALGRTAEALRLQKAQIEQQNMRFETALDHMSQGLCFFDREERLIVCNRRYLEIYDLDPGRVTPGMSLSEIVDMRVEAGSSPVMEKSAYLKWRDGALKESDASTIACQLKNGRTVEIRICPMADGAWVATHVDITEKCKLNERLEHNNRLLAHLATHDALTGLANRVLFRERLDAAFAAGRENDDTLALLLLDLDKFKEVNDTRGHPAGDLLLRLVADRLAGCARSEDTVARLGGDEFAIIVHGNDATRSAVRIAMRVHRAIRAPFDLSGMRVTIGTSIGIAVLSPQIADVDELIKVADVALYESKADRDAAFKVSQRKVLPGAVTPASEKAA
jgi:diguanylate cyclase (GGDEF)-like protein